MNIVVLIKQVPDTTDVRIDPRTGTLIREGVPSIINPDDKHALEEGLRIRERFGGTVTVLSMGPPQAEDALMEARAMGADVTVLVSDRAFAGSDTLATSVPSGFKRTKSPNPRCCLRKDRIPSAAVSLFFSLKDTPISSALCLCSLWRDWTRIGRSSSTTSSMN